MRPSENDFSDGLNFKYSPTGLYSGLNLNQDKATKPQTVQIVRQGEATPYWFKFNPLYLKVILHPYNALTPSKFQVSRFPVNP